MNLYFIIPYLISFLGFDEFALFSFSFLFFFGGVGGVGGGGQFIVSEFYLKNFGVNRKEKMISHNKSSRGIIMPTNLLPPNENRLFD